MGLPAFLRYMTGKIGDWIRFNRREIVFFLVIFFVATLSFGLGYLSNRELNHAPIIIEKAASEN